MTGITIELPHAKAQAEFNLRRWEEVLSDPVLQKIEGRVETDRYGRITLYPLAPPHHGRNQGNAALWLKKLLPDGETIIACPISTADGVRTPDVAWVSKGRWIDLGNRACFLEAPEICVEVITPGESEKLTGEKTALYFDAGAKEVWLCGSFGTMTFLGPGSTSLEASQLCPEFPDQI